MSKGGIGMKKNAGAVGYKKAIGLGLFGIVLVVVGETLDLYWHLDGTLPSTLRILLVTIGSVLFGTGVIDGMFQLRFHRQIQDEVTALSRNIHTLQDTVMIAKGAVDAGLTAVYATRDECLSQIKQALTEALAKAEGKHDREKTEVSILGISLGDFLCPHGSLQPTFRSLLKSDSFKINVAILQDGSNAAYCRAIHEEAGKFKDVLPKGTNDHTKVQDIDGVGEVYQNTKCHDELKTATDYLLDLGRRLKIDRGEPDKDEEVKASLTAYTYQSHPMAFIFVMDDDMFVESYHMAGRGGEAPILRVSRCKRQTMGEESKLFKIYSGHYDSVIEMSTRIVCSDPDEEAKAEPKP
jgi:hypothetical protein